MRALVILFSLLLLCQAAPGFAEESEKPENIVGKMSYKFTRGVTNLATAPAEIPKQCILSARDDGAVGFVIGPLKGIGMTVYRAFIGSIESIFFLVPQPGNYDSTIDPEFVWNGWEKQRFDYEEPAEIGTTEPVTDKKVE